MGHKEVRCLTQGHTDSWEAGMWTHTCLPGGCALQYHSLLLSSPETDINMESRDTRMSIRELQKGIEGESPACVRVCIFPWRSMFIPLLRFSDPINLRTIILPPRELPSGKTFYRQRRVWLTGQNKSRLVFGWSPKGLDRWMSSSKVREGEEAHCLTQERVGCFLPKS